MCACTPSHPPVMVTQEMATHAPCVWSASSTTVRLLQHLLLLHKLIIVSDMGTYTLRVYIPLGFQPVPSR
jgi:hypothetical protein